MKDSLGDRMKSQYENRSKHFLTRRCPTIIRLDGKAFHTYTKDLNRPFDEGLIEDMQQTAIYLCENIQGANCAYAQSDEISILITDYDKITSQAWFDYNVQKMTSVSASYATAKFNQLRLLKQVYPAVDREDYKKEITQIKLAQFDSRAFQIADHEEVVNYFIWRQQDATRNSIQMLAQSLYSHEKLQGKNSSDLQELCFQKGHNWNDLDTCKKRGTLIVKNTYADDKLINSDDIRFHPELNKYVLDDKIGGFYEYDSIKTKWECIETPIFTQDREIIKSLL